MAYYENQSMELYGHADSLVFDKNAGCWGYFTETFYYNNVILQDCPKSIQQHSGGNSSLLAIDMDGDDDLELIVGNHVFKNMVLLTNTTVGVEADFTLQDTAFPSNTTPINLPYFPAASYLDLNNDGVKDLVVSSHNRFYSDNKYGIHYYQNNGENNMPVFEYVQNDLIQDQMIDVGYAAYPVFFDYNNDSLLDLVIGNYGTLSHPDSVNFESSLTLYENYGNEFQPKYKLITEDYSNLLHLDYIGLIPTFGDLDGDGDKDLLMGNKDGDLLYYENTSVYPAPAYFEFVEKNYQNIQVQKHSAPQLFDVDRDGRLDLLVGELFGTIAYYRDTKTTGAPSFELVTSKLGNVKVNTPPNLSGFSVPRMFEENGEYKLLVGAENGAVRFYRHIDGNLDGNFIVNTNNLTGIYEGERSGVAIADINNDSYLDIIIGNAGGGLAFYKGQDTTVGVLEIKTNSILVNVYPNPTSGIVNIEFNEVLKGRINVSVYNVMGEIIFSDRIKNKRGTTIDLSAHSNGVYYLKITNGVLSASRKVILVK
ncbi:MAG: T9SS type A sorting domain-containing protein [Flavobacteriales bacterium]|nr:T9SS type A sorting domain-containing protein [Flavobacteriales bacterium]